MSAVYSGAAFLNSGWVASEPVSLNCIDHTFNSRPTPTYQHNHHIKHNHCPAAGVTQSLHAADIGDYNTTVLFLHNNHRCNNSAVDLTWSDSLARTAAKIAALCVCQHDTITDGGGYGQTMGTGFTPGQIAFMITNATYNEEINRYPTPYRNDNPDLRGFSGWGHYSQIVWAGTTQIGCATQYRPNGLANTANNVPPYVMVCNYSPPGNYVGEFSNVHAPLGRDTIVIV